MFFFLMFVVRASRAFVVLGLQRASGLQGVRRSGFRVYSRSPKVGNPIASILKSNV